jgi:hypothetical protein
MRCATNEVYYAAQAFKFGLRAGSTSAFNAEQVMYNHFGYRTPINFKTARTLGLTIPIPLLGRELRGQCCAILVHGISAHRILVRDHGDGAGAREGLRKRAFGSC